MLLFVSLNVCLLSFFFPPVCCAWERRVELEERRARQECDAAEGNGEEVCRLVYACR